MIKKIASILLIFISIISCSRSTIIEDVVEHYDEGNKKVVHYYAEKRNGERTWVKEVWFYKEGMKHLEGPIVNGKRNGEFKSYNKSGNILSEGIFVNGKREGKATIYHENGNIHYEGFYKEGKECGIWKFYDENGTLYNEVNKDQQ